MKHQLLILILAGVWNCTLFAQLPTVLTLEECIHRAEQNSFRLLSDDYEITIAENDALIAESRAIPIVGGELATENRFLQPYYFNQMWASVHSDWSLGDLILKTGRSANQDIETRRLEKEQNRLNVIGRSTSLYMSILQVNKQIEILGIRSRFLQQHLQVTQGLWEAGVRSQLDVLQTESEIVKLQEDSIRLAIVSNNLNVELARILGWENVDNFLLAPVRLDSIATMPVPQVTLQGLNDNPVLATFDSRLTAQQFRTEELTARQIPHIRVGSGYVGDGDPTGDGNYWHINAGVVIPIYAGNAITYQKQVSNAVMESLDAQKKEAEREIIIHLIKVQEKMGTLKDLMDLQQQRQKITALAVDLVEANYEAGISSNLDYLSLQQSLTNIQLAIEETLLEYTTALIEFYITTNQTDRIVALGNKQNE